MSFRTYVFIAKDLKSSKRLRKVYRVEATDNVKADLIKATQAAKRELTYNPAYGSYMLYRVWQVVDGGAK